MASPRGDGKRDGEIGCPNTRRTTVEGVNEAASLAPHSWLNEHYPSIQSSICIVLLMDYPIKVYAFTPPIGSPEKKQQWQRSQPRQRQAR
jgi:hypothetical protein